MIGIVVLFAAFIFVIYWVTTKNLKKRYIFFLLINPLIFFPIFSFTYALVTYSSGVPTLTYCGEPHGKYHPEYRMKTLNSDCDFPVLDFLTDNVRNYTTIQLFKAFGYSKGSYLNKLPSQNEITKEFFHDSFEIIKILGESPFLLLENNDSIYIGPFYANWIISDEIQKPTYRYKIVNHDLFVIGVFNEKEYLTDSFVYLRTENEMINIYNYK